MRIRHIAATIAAAALTLVASVPANAQYYEIANQLTNLITPALQGGVAYKGYVEVDGLAGLGTNRANFVGVSTSQGFRRSNWFFMGAGLGVDAVMTKELNISGGPNGSTTKAMIPVFTDFRFNIGSSDSRSIGAYVDIKVGASWLIGSGYLQLEDGILNNNTQFFLRPSVGVRIPVNAQKPAQAVNIGLTYQLLTSNFNYVYSYGRPNNVTLNNLGVSVSFEW